MKSLMSVLAVGTALLGLSLVVPAMPSHADDYSSIFGDKYHELICDLIAQEPTPHGIWAANSYLMSEQVGPYFLNYGEMQSAIGYAITGHCTQYRSIYSAYMGQY